MASIGFAVVPDIWERAKQHPDIVVFLTGDQGYGDKKKSKQSEKTVDAFDIRVIDPGGRGHLIFNTLSLRSDGTEQADECAAADRR